MTNNLRNGFGSLIVGILCKTLEKGVWKVAVDDTDLLSPTNCDNIIISCNHTKAYCKVIECETEIDGKIIVEKTEKGIYEPMSQCEDLLN